jgi:hypothetical protein
MKKIVTLALVVCAMVFKAQDASKVFSSSEMVWFGLDFTKAKFVGQFDQGMGAAPATGSDMKNKFIPEWNALIVKEPQNFDLRKTFRKDNVFNDISSINELNSKIDVDACMSFNATKIDRATIESMVKKYSSAEKKEGLGLAFIVENFDKGLATAGVYITFFDIATKKVLLSEKVEGKARGVGIRNYWAGAIKDILKKIDAEEYKNWKK